MRFYLGTHLPHWLWDYKDPIRVPLFISIRRLRGIKIWKPATASFAVDSGGFTELSSFGRWKLPAKTYVQLLIRLCRTTGYPDFAAIQDWMCEPQILKKTGKTIYEHQQLTIRSYLELSQLCHWLPWLPVLQGWRQEDYIRHIEMYCSAGIDLTKFPVVGVGTMCRRQATNEAAEILEAIHDKGISIHGFGLKKQGVAKAGQFLYSADSLAWSFCARYSHIRLPGCTHKNCANCRKYALTWRQELIKDAERTGVKIRKERGDIA